MLGFANESKLQFRLNLFESFIVLVIGTLTRIIHKLRCLVHHAIQLCLSRVLLLNPRLSTKLIHNIMSIPNLIYLKFIVLCQKVDYITNADSSMACQHVNRWERGLAIRGILDQLRVDTMGADPQCFDFTTVSSQTDLNRYEISLVKGRMSDLSSDIHMDIIEYEF